MHEGVHTHLLGAARLSGGRPARPLGLPLRAIRLAPAHPAGLHGAPHRTGRLRQAAGTRGRADRVFPAGKTARLPRRSSRKTCAAGWANAAAASHWTAHRLVRHSGMAQSSESGPDATTLAPPRWALVTGATSGIGLQVSVALAKRGYAVTLLGRAASNDRVAGIGRCCRIGVGSRIWSPTAIRGSHRAVQSQRRSPPPHPQAAASGPAPQS